MNLNPANWFARKSPADPISGGAFSRESNPLGPWSGQLDQWVAREVAPQQYEAMREAIPVLDAAINRLVTMDGIPRAEAESDSLQRELDDWMQRVQVGDLQQGYQSFYAAMGNELYEQGFALGEFVLAEDGRDVARLNVADSKGVIFRRQEGLPLAIYYRPPTTIAGTNRDGKKPVEQILRNTASTGQMAQWLDENQYQPLDRSTIVYAGLHVENDNPYGVSIMRSMEFCAQILLTIDNAVQQSWRRFGDPSFSATYKTKRNLSQTELNQRQDAIASNIAKVVADKQAGKSSDLVHAIGANDDLTVAILGAGGDVLDLEIPAKHILEQIVAKTGLPPWLLGYVWGTAERLALKQAEILLQESRTRWAQRVGGLELPVAAMLRARRRTWKPGDWRLVQELPNLQDVLAQANAEFLAAQTELMRSNAGAVEITTTPTDDGKAASRVSVLPSNAYTGPPPAHFVGANKMVRKAPGGEGWAESDPELPKLESEAIDATLAKWQQLRDDMLAELGLDSAAKAEGVTFAFDDAVTAALIALQDDFIAAVGAPDGVLIARMYRAWVRGIANAAAELNIDATLTEIADNAAAAIADRGLELVRTAAVRVLQDDIIEALQAGEYDGLNPRDVARMLAKRFDLHNYDWERLARSELTIAHAEGKMAEYAEMEIEQYDYATAQDSRVSEKCRALEAAGPYPVGNGPLPMRDSHPNCRCTVMPVVQAQN